MVLKDEILCFRFIGGSARYYVEQRLQKYQGRFVLDQTITKKIKVGINANYTYSKKYGTIVSESQTSPTASLMYALWGTVQWQVSMTVIC